MRSVFGHWGPVVAALGLVEPTVSVLTSRLAFALESQRNDQVEQASRPDPRGRLVASFDNWEVREGLTKNTYLLISHSRDDQGQFWLECDRRGLLTVAVPLLGKDGSKRLRSQRISISSDAGVKRDFSLLVFSNYVALGLDSEMGPSDSVGFFLDVLRASRKVFALSYNDRTLEFDVAHFRAALATFTRQCRERSITGSAR